MTRYTISHQAPSALGPWSFSANWTCDSLGVKEDSPEAAVAACKVALEIKSRPYIMAVYKVAGLSQYIAKLRVNHDDPADYRYAVLADAGYLTGQTVTPEWMQGREMSRVPMMDKLVASHLGACPGCCRIFDHESAEITMPEIA